MPEMRRCKRKMHMFRGGASCPDKMLQRHVGTAKIRWCCKHETRFARLEMHELR